MSTNVTFNGQTYAIPAEGDSGWGTVLSNYFIAISTGALQKSGGNFTLTSEVNFGATYGLKAPYFKSTATNPAGTGIVRLGNNEALAWRNAANSADLSLKVDGTDTLVFNGTSLTVGGQQVQTAITVADTSTIALTLNTNQITAIVKAASLDDSHIANAAAIAYSKLAALTASRALVSDGSGFVSASSVSATELGYLSGVTSAIQTQLNAKEGSLAAGTTAQYYRGDKSWQTLDKSAVGLGNVDNTSDATKNAATATLQNKTFGNATAFNAEIIGAAHTDATAGATISATAPTTLVKNLTGAVTNVAGIGGVTGVQILIVTNYTGSDVTVLNQSTSASASDRIITGNDADLTFKTGASLWLVYDPTAFRWRIVGGSGGSTAYESSDLTLTASDTIAINASSADQVWRVQGNAGPIDLSTTPFSGTPQNLTEVMLVGNHDINTVTITYNDASNGCVGNFQSITLYKYQTAKFRYLSSISRWVYVE